jgi:hypothetical protein
MKARWFYNTEIIPGWRVPGVSTPVHRHDCQEVFVILSGNGTATTRKGLITIPFGVGSTVYIPPNDVHRIANTGAEPLRMIVTISRPPIRAFVYDGWDTPDGLAKLEEPYFWDRTCPGQAVAAAARKVRVADRD